MIYLLKLTLCWAAFALIYSLLLREETFFRVNRALILLAALGGILLPLLPSLPAEMVFSALVLPEVAVGFEKIGQIENAALGTDRINWLWAFYGLGLVYALLRFGAGLLQIAYLAASGQREKLPNGLTLVRHVRASAPFSFFTWIFVAPDFGDEPGSRDMLTHESAHARGLHSADVLFFEVLCIVFWFHPLAHWLRRAIRGVHEYLADAETVRRSDRKQYGLLLIRQTQSGPAFAMANHFFASQLKNRIVMLTKKASSPARSGWKYALAVLVFPAFALLFQQKALAQTASAIAAEPMTVETNPEFPGGFEALVKFLGANLKYPEDAKKAGAEGRLLMQLIIEADGKVSEVVEKDFRGGKRTDSMVKEAMRVVLAMPKWKPATIDGKPVKSTIALPIMFKLDNEKK